VINRDILIYIRHLTGATIMSKPTVKSAIKSEPEEVTNLDRFDDEEDDTGDAYDESMVPGDTASIMKKVDDILRLIPARGGVKKDNVSSIRAQLLDLLRSSTGATEGKVDTGGEDSAMEATVSPSGDADATVDVIPPVLLNTMTAMMYVIAQMGASVAEMSNTMSSNSLSRPASWLARPSNNFA